jgi:hypothetical protein
VLRSPPTASEETLPVPFISRTRVCDYSEKIAPMDLPWRHAIDFNRFREGLSNHTFITIQMVIQEVCTEALNATLSS